MCGLIGYSGKTTYNLDKIKFLMLWNSIERGRDATGMYSPHSGVIKTTEPAGKFMYGKEIAALQEDNVLICHVRAKTVGNNTTNNAHPFEKGDIVLAHNGTLTNHLGQTGLAAKYDLKYNDYDVDSQIIAVAVNKAFQKEGDLHIDVIEEYEGAAALLFYNKKTENLYTFHDALRPLFYGWDKDSNMYISSIKDSLEAIEVYGVSEFTPNILYTIKDGEIIAEQKYQLYDELHPKPVVIFNSRKARRREKHQKLPKLGINQRGFTRDEIKSWYLPGFYLKAICDVRGGGKGEFLPFAWLTKGGWYYVEGFFNEDSMWIQVKDDTNVISQVGLHCFDLSFFIPKKGDYFMLNSGVTSKKGKEKIFSKGEIAFVRNVDYQNEVLEVIDNINGEPWEVGFSFGRIVSKEEYENKGKIIEAEIVADSSLVPSLFTQGNPLGDLMKIQQDKVEEEKRIQAILKHQESEHSPFKEQETIDEQETPIDSINDDEYIAREIYDTLVDLIQGKINLLEEKHESNQPIAVDINDIHSTLNMAKDPSFLHSVYQGY